MKHWLQSWQEWALAITGALGATWALVRLIPRLLAVARSLYVRLAYVVEISDTLARMEHAQNLRHQRIEDGLLNIIQTKRLVMDADDAHAFFECDERGHLIWSNRRWHIITGLEHDQARGTGWENGIAPEDKPRVCMGWQQAIDHQRAYEDEITYINRSGVRTRMRVSASPIRNGSGLILGWLGIGTNIAIA